jgi:hypothetical protein
MARRKKDVLRLDVAVNDSAAVRTRQRVGNLRSNAKRIRNRQTTFAPYALAQTFTLDEGHRIVKQTASLSRGQEGQDVGMLQPRNDLDLTLESLGVDGAGEISWEQFDHHFPAEPYFLGEENAGHPTATQLSLYGVARAQRHLKRRT